MSEPRRRKTPMSEPRRHRTRAPSEPGRGRTGATGEERLIDARIATQAMRLHLNVGAVCNNNCIFCMEDDRESRFRENSAVSGQVLRQILEDNRGAEEVCFTCGEPTTNPELPLYVAWARALGYRRISVMTNGRMLAHPPNARALVERGMNRFYLSVHGHTAKLHEGLTRTPGSFDQTVRGLEVLAELKRTHRLELHTSTVVTARNLPWFGPIYEFLRARGADQLVFNVLQPAGRALTFFDTLFPQYSAIAAAFGELIAQAPETARGERVPAFLVDIPLCVTTAIPVALAL